MKQCVSVKENIANFPKKSNNKKSVQMNTFLDRRVNTEVFLKPFEKKTLLNILLLCNIVSILVKKFIVRETRTQVGGTPVSYDFKV